MIDISRLTKDQKYALDVMIGGENVFLTGEAGTGKSEVVKIFIEEARKKDKQLLIMAPTGTAADNLHGETIHRALDAKIGIQKNNRTLTERKDVLRVADVVIIDEISMCRFDLFEYVARRILYENEMRAQDRRNLEMSKLTGYTAEQYDKYPVKKNDLQLIVLGDFYQLPPIINDDDAAELSGAYKFDFGEGFAFKSKCWDMMNFHSVLLTEVVRQEDKAFKDILSEIRKADSKSKLSCIDFLMRNSSDFPMVGDDSINLIPTNKKCKQFNDRELSKLDTPSKTYVAVIEGDVNDGDKNFVDDEIILKEGCKVMLTINDSAGKYVNGTMGIVKRLREDTVDVLTEDGKVVTIGRFTKEITKPVVHTKTIEKWVEEEQHGAEGNLIKDENGDVVSKAVLKKITKETITHEVVGSFSQLPIRVAYAITIHKSQGKTFNKINLDPYAWANGQFYTALSRGKRIENICFLQTIQPRFIKTSDAVKKFMRNLEKASSEIEV